MPSISLADIARRAAEATVRIEQEMQTADKQPIPEQSPEPAPTAKPADVVPAVDPKEAVAIKAKALQSTLDSESNEPISKTFMRVAESAIALTPEEAAVVQASFSGFRKSLNYQGIVKRCPAPACPDKCEHFKICPFQEINKYPTGKLCPVESLIVDREMQEYYSLIRQTVSPEQEVPFSIVNMILSLIECDISEIRMRSKLEEDGYTRMRSIFTPNGTLLTVEEDITKAFEIKDRVGRRKDTIMKSLMLTPEIRHKYHKEETGEKQMSPADALVIARGKLKAKTNKPGS